MTTRSAAATRTFDLVRAKVRGESIPHVQGHFGVTIDTREQRPWSVPIWVPWKVEKLDAGDYALTGHEGSIAIERKSLSDFVGSITAGHDRFRRELEVLRGYKFAAVVVEATHAEVWRHEYRSQIDPARVLQIAAALSAKYVHVHFVGSPTHACAFAFGMLKSAWSLHTDSGKR